MPFPFTSDEYLLTTKGIDNKETLAGINSKLKRIQGTTMINAITTGNKTVQQYDIN